MDFNLVKYYDKKYEINAPQVFSIKTGPTDMIQYPINSDAASATRQNFYYNPAKNVILSNKLLISGTVDLRITGTAGTAGPNLLQNGFWGIKSYPLNKSLQSTILNLNGQVITTTPQQLISSLERYNKMIDKEDGITYTTPDVYQSYITSTAQGRNVLGYDLIYPNDNGEYGFLNHTNAYQIISNTPTEAVIRINIYEPLLTGSTAFFESEQFWPNLDNINLSLVFGDWTDVFRYDNLSVGHPVITSVVVEGISRFIMNVRSSYPLIDQPILNRDYYYPYSSYQVVDNTIDLLPNLSAGQSTTINITNVNLSNVFSYMMIYVDDPNPTLFTTDCALGIENIKVQMDNKNSLLDTLDTKMLYQIAKENGYRHTYSDWAGLGYSGSYLLVALSDLSTDIHYAGENSPVNLQIQLRIKNLSSGKSFPRVRCRCIMINNGILTIRKDRKVDTVTNFITFPEYVAARSVGAACCQKKSLDSNMVGGAFGLGTIASWAARVLPWVAERVVGCRQPLIESAKCLATGSTGAGLGNSPSCGGAKSVKKKDFKGKMY